MTTKNSIEFVRGLHRGHRRHAVVVADRDAIDQRGAVRVQLRLARSLVAVEASNSSLSTYSINANGSLSSIGTVSDGGSGVVLDRQRAGLLLRIERGQRHGELVQRHGRGVPSLLNATAASTHPGTTDSAASPDGQFLYVESGGGGALDAFAVERQRNAYATRDAVEPAEALRRHRGQLTPSTCPRAPASGRGNVGM